MKKFVVRAVATVTICGLVAGCESKAGSGAIIGSLGGAAVGGIIGNNSKGRTLEGAAIGAGVGAIGGALVGHGLDKADEKKAKEREYQREEATYGYGTRAPASNKVSQRDVVDWTSRGVKDDVIIDRIERSGQVFRLTAADANDLRDAGVSESVITAMKATARRG